VRVIKEFVFSKDPDLVGVPNISSSTSKQVFAADSTLLSSIRSIGSAELLVASISIPVGVLEFHNILSITPVRQVKALVPSTTKDFKIYIDCVTVSPGLTVEMS
jgi:hypothetical protein